MPILGASETIPGVAYDNGGVLYHSLHPDRTLAGNGTTDDSEALSALATAAGANGLVYLAGSKTYKIAANVTLSCGINFGLGAILKPASGVTITINGPIISAVQGKLFDTSLGGKIVLSPRSVERVFPQWWGAVADGVTDDSAPAQGCVDCALGPVTAPHAQANMALNIPIHFPAGAYICNDVKLSKYVMGARITGAGRFATLLKSTTANTPVFRTNGFSYSVMDGIAFNGSASNTGSIFELDWDGGAGGAGHQSSTFSNLYLEGNQLTAFGVRIGNSGFMGSENLFQNCFFSGCTTAGYCSANFNALQNTIIGGNFQGCYKYGVYVLRGSVNLLAVGFQNYGGGGTYNAAQIEFNGADIRIDNSSDDISTFRGCRSESHKFLSAVIDHSVVLDGCNLLSPRTYWTPSTAVPLQALWTGTTTAGDGKLYRCTTAGTTGATEPTWNGGVVTDGTVTWTPLNYNAVEALGCIKMDFCTIPMGQVSVSQTNAKVPSAITNSTFSRADWLTGNPYGATPTMLRLDNNVVRRGGGPQTGGAPMAYAAGDVAGAQPPFSALSQMNLGMMPLLFSTLVSGNQIGGDVGFVRASASRTIAALNTLGLIGTLAAPLPASANVAGNDTIISGGQGTGTGVSGKLRLRAAPAGGAGVTPNTPVDVAMVDEAGLALTTAGTGFKVKEGTNATMGVATLVGGTVTVSTTKVTANSRILLTHQNSSGTVGFLIVSARTAGTSFTILSSNAADTSQIAWVILEPSP